MIEISVDKSSEYYWLCVVLGAGELNCPEWAVKKMKELNHPTKYTISFVKSDKFVNDMLKETEEK